MALGGGRATFPFVRAEDETETESAVCTRGGQHTALWVVLVPLDARHSPFLPKRGEWLGALRHPSFRRPLVRGSLPDRRDLV